jgi:hypothetical protein
LILLLPLPVAVTAATPVILLSDGLRFGISVHGVLIAQPLRKVYRTRGSESASGTFST